MFAQHLQPPIHMLFDAINRCPDDIWARADGNAPIWQHVLHATYYLQKWMRAPNEPFAPPSFVTRAGIELEAPPEPALERETLRQYLEEVAANTMRLLKNAKNDEILTEIVINGNTYTVMDIALGQMRHIAYHVGCISTLLHRYTGESLPWIGYDGLTVD